ncbi:T9SS type A sorting domain-containing protein [Pontibacter sp. H249]|uniref:T9SS type A sorting domain-containing protein n=1 Tax=Pontibacter sp. H249 TaxID=3133420 RepID=UPI0030BEC26D
MKKIYLFMLLILLCITGSFATNLVKNPGFEQRNDSSFCPADELALGPVVNDYVATYWKRLQSADYFHTCATNEKYKPSFGAEPVRDGGNAYAGFIGLYSTHYTKSEYLYQQLDNPLQAGVTYYVEFWVSLRDDSRYSVPSLGMYFAETENEITTQSMGLHNLSPQIGDRSFTSYYDNKTGWTKISGYFTPQSDNISFFVIGNFDPTIGPSTALKQETGNGCTDSSEECYAQAYYFLDDVVIKACDDFPASVTSISGPSSDLCNSFDEATFTISPIVGAVSYEWRVVGSNLLGGVQTSNTFKLTGRMLGGEGTYTLRARAFNLCGPSPTWFEVNVYVINCGGCRICNYSMSSYPNPADESIVIEMNEEYNSNAVHQDSDVPPYEVRLLDKGQVVVKQIKSIKKKVALDVRSLPSGIYFLQVTDGHRILSKQISIQH